MVDFDTKKWIFFLEKVNLSKWSPCLYLPHNSYSYYSCTSSSIFELCVNLPFISSLLYTNLHLQKIKGFAIETGTSIPKLLIESQSGIYFMKSRWPVPTNNWVKVVIIVIIILSIIINLDCRPANLTYSKHRSSISHRLLCLFNNVVY